MRIQQYTCDRCGAVALSDSIPEGWCNLRIMVSEGPFTDLEPIGKDLCQSCTTALGIERHPNGRNKPSVGDHLIGIIEDIAAGVVQDKTGAC